MIEIIPAIDIIDGRCVRLTQGDYRRKNEYGDPLEMAKLFEDHGITGDSVEMRPRFMAMLEACGVLWTSMPFSCAFSIR